MTAITVTEQQQNIERAQKCINPIDSLSDMTKYQNENLEVSFYTKRKADMDQKIIKWAFKLAETNVGPYYKTCGLGWQPKIKQSDLNKNWARYLVALDKKTKSPIAYSMFRFDLDYGTSVLYCYELHVAEKFQNNGLGTFMMKILEEIARQWKMEKVVLTVLKNDDGALRFYQRLGYTVDETSPDKEDKAEYEIYSKVM